MKYAASHEGSNHTVFWMSAACLVLFGVLFGGAWRAIRAVSLWAVNLDRLD